LVPSTGQEPMLDLGKDVMHTRRHR
jgi:hypothetical protein